MGPFLAVRAPVASRPVTANARRVPDYAARRSGGDPENQRRRSGSGTMAPSSYSAPSNGSNGVRPNPAVLRRKSVDYSARRAGGEEENNRRRGSGGYSAPSNYSPSSNGSSSYSAPSGGARPNPAVLRRKSVDYSARRAGGEEENNRRRGGASGYSAPVSQTSFSSAASSSAPRGNLVSPQVAKRKSIDYSARRSGSTRENARRSSSFSSPSSYSSAASGSAPRGNLVSAQVAKRKSIDYSARRSGATREEHRRRSSSPRPASSSSYASSYSASTPAPKSNLVSPQVLKRRTADYSARRSGGRNQGRR